MCVYIYVVFLKTTSQLASGSHYWNLQRCPVLCLCANYIFMIFKYGGNMLRLKKPVAEEHTCIFSWQAMGPHQRTVTSNNSEKGVAKRNAGSQIWSGISTEAMVPRNVNALLKCVLCL